MRGPEIKTPAISANNVSKSFGSKDKPIVALSSLDFTVADSRFSREPAHTSTPEREFDRRWALELLGDVLTQLEAEYTAAGKAAIYCALRPALSGTPDAAGYAAIATELGMTTDAVKKAAQRLRERYRAVIRERIAATVDRPEDIDDEIRSLFAAVSG